MKRNILPLLGIAFVVAIISTGVFYGLFAGRMHSASAEGAGQSIVVAAKNLDRGAVVQASDLRVSQLKGSLQGSFSKPEEAVGATLLEAVLQNEPLLQDRVASRDAKSGGAASTAIPAGMRALSIRVTESNGVVGLLRKGAKVDVQAVLERNGNAELRTILQNVEVLAVSPQLEPAIGNRPPGTGLTVLARAQDADLVALADSSARIRVTLRNPLDDGTAQRHSLGLATVFGGAGALPGLESPQQATAKADPGKPAPVAVNNFDHPVQLHVQVLGASSGALSILDSKLTGSAANGSMQVAAFLPDTDAGELVLGLQQKQELEVVSAWTLTAGVGRPISFHAGTAPEQLRVLFSPVTDASGKVSLRVKPEITLQRDEGVETRKYDADLPDGASFLVQGFLKTPSERGLLDRLYPGHSWSGRELVIFVTTRGRKQSSTTALAQSNRGR
jgi:Flp pilus assembly protein CpaB